MIMENSNQQAPGGPGIPPRWTSSAKSGLGTALNPSSHVWFTISHGIFDEIYYPRVDQACTRDMGLIVTDGESFFSEEKRDTEHHIEYLEEGIPAYRLTNVCKQDRYRIKKEILTDPSRDVLLQRTQFEAIHGSLEDYHIFVLLAPHLSNQGAGNDAWIDEYKGIPMLFAQRGNTALALASSTPWRNRSAGFVGFSDGWQDLHLHKQMTWTYSQASDGNVALTGEVGFASTQGKFVLALGFGKNPAEAAQRAISSLQEGFESSRKAYIQGWRDWHKKIMSIETQDKVRSRKDLFHISATVLRIHEAKSFPGGMIASLSIPWGFVKGDDDLGGYHLVWPRDLVEAAGGLLAIGAKEDARHVLRYLQATQEAEGNWPQNMWLDGTPYWSGIQMDETAFPILLVELAHKYGALRKADLPDFWPMVRRAASYLVRNGPVTQQDRWEEDPGYSPFTLAVEVAALLTAAALAETQSEPQIADYLRQTADTWNENIERWTYVENTDLAKKNQVDGYYVRIAPLEKADAASPAGGFVPIKNRPPGMSSAEASQIVSPDALALVRFGLRAPDDPRILNTIKVVDDLLKVDMPLGPAWHRYNDDGYGEHENGSPFDGTGIGRAWPLLVGERAHYALVAGKREEAVSLIQTLESFASPGGMLPEQIWDSRDIPEKELFCGKPSGSAMPLVWAHAEYVKLLRSLEDGQVFDMPAQTLERYIKKGTVSSYAFWRFNHKCQSIPKGKKLRIEVLSPAMIHWSENDWDQVQDVKTTDTGLGVHIADLLTDDLPSGSKINFTIYWLDQDRWEGRDYSVQIEAE